MISDLIIENQYLFDQFVKRYKKYNIGSAELVQEMAEDGIVMDRKRLQRFIIHGSQKRITQKAYIWLLYRHGIDVSLSLVGREWDNEYSRLKAKQFTDE